MFTDFQQRKMKISNSYKCKYNSSFKQVDNERNKRMRLSIIIYTIALITHKVVPSMNYYDKDNSMSENKVMITVNGFSRLSRPNDDDSSSIPYIAADLTRKKRNKRIKTINGNKSSRGKGIRLISWNNGNSELQNRMNEIKILVNDQKPEILGLTESNYKRGTDARLVAIDNYNLHTEPTFDNDKLRISRVVVYTHKDLIVKRKPDLEDPEIWAIWLELGLPRQRKIIVENIYSEWQFMGQDDNTSLSITSQMQRWKVFLDKLGEVLNEDREVLVLGDVNLDFL